MDEAHYDTPWEFLHRTPSYAPRDRPQSDSSDLLSSTRHDLMARTSRAREEPAPCSSNQSPDLGSRHEPNGANVRQRSGRVQQSDPEARRASSTEFERGRFKFCINRLRERANGREARKRYREEDIIHRGIDRTEAERLLTTRETGAFLIRVRDNGTLALSIRAASGVLHIKLELRSNLWVLGEGPSFSSIISIITFYRCHELPIRGAERMLLSKPVLTSECQAQLPYI